MFNYDEQANNFCEKYGIKIKWEFLGREVNKAWGDSAERNHWKFTIRRKGKSYTNDFWDSIINSKHIEPKEPTSYDLLACLTKYHPGTFEDFCDEFGYNTDSRNAERTYKAVMKEYEGLRRVFGTYGENPELWEGFMEIA